MIAVIDYGLGNLRSVSKALESLGANVEVTDSPETILNANGVILPGVGAFYHGMNNLEKLGLVSVIKETIKAQKPFFGICLGLQLLFSETEEHGTHKGLDIIKGKVLKFDAHSKIPHMGWNQINAKENVLSTKLFNNIPQQSYFYFVHSYYVAPENKDVIATTTDYGMEFTSAIAKNNIWGVQFHPEKSSDLGLKILANFIEIVRK